MVTLLPLNSFAVTVNWTLPRMAMLVACCSFPCKFEFNHHRPGCGEMLQSSLLPGHHQQMLSPGNLAVSASQKSVSEQ